MRTFRLIDLGIAQKILLIEFCVLVLTIVPLSVFFLQQLEQAVREEFQQKSHDRLDDLAFGLRLPLWNFDKHGEHELLEQTVREELVVGLVLKDEHGVVVDSLFEPGGERSSAAVMMSAPIVFKDRKLGTIECYFDSNFVTEKNRRSLLRVAGVSAVCFLAILALTFVFVEMFLIRRLRKLKSQAAALSRGDLDYSVSWQQRDEIGILGMSFENARVVIRDSLAKLENSNRQLQELNHQLEERVDQKTSQVVQAAKLASLGEMAAGVAHEINNPLAIVEAATLSMALRPGDSEGFEKKKGIILKNIQRISKIISGLRKFSRSSERAEKKKCLLPEIVSEALALVEIKARLSAVTVTCDANALAAGRGVIYCNDLEIEQVIVNLLNNAIDAIDELPEKWVRLEIGENSTGPWLRVRDSGKGIPPSVVERLFQPFFTTKKIGVGTGLGLSISKGILEEHSASLRLETDAPNTTFFVQFPRPEAIADAA